MRESRFRELLTRARAATVEGRARLLRDLADEHDRTHAEMGLEEIKLFLHLCELLLAHANLLDRLAFARRVAPNPFTPKPVIDRLLDDDHLVSSAVVEAAPLPDARLLQLMAARDSERLEIAIAHRPALSETISGVLVSKGRTPVMTAIAANAQAHLSRTSLDMLCDHAVRLTDLGRALARRGDLPPAFAGMLRERMDARSIVTAVLSDAELIALAGGEDGTEATQVAIAWRAPLAECVTDVLIGHGRPRVMLAVASNLGARLSHLGFQILADVAVTQAEMDEALARRPDLPPSIAGRLHRRLSERMRSRIDDLLARDLDRGRRMFVLRQA